MTEIQAVSDNEGAQLDGVSRRSMLKRGAAVGVTLAWAVPVVSAVSMTPAHAESPSAPPSNQGNQGSGTDSNATQVTGSAGAGGLASTGSDASLAAAAGVAAAVLGAGAIAASKYRGRSAEAGEE